MSTSTSAASDSYDNKNENDPSKGTSAASDSGLLPPSNTYAV